MQTHIEHTATRRGAGVLNPDGTRLAIVEFIDQLHQAVEDAEVTS